MEIRNSRQGINKVHGATSGGTRTPEFVAWLSMRQRCTDSNHSNWKRYGGRGVTVCDRWLGSFANFLADMGPKPGPDYSLDRIDPNGGYEPSNCRWASFVDQQNNRRNNLTINVDGERLTAVQLAQRIGIPSRTANNRIHKYNEGLLPLEQVMVPGRRSVKVLPTGESLTQAAKRLGVTPPAIAYRLRRVAAGLMTIDEALGTRP